MRYEGQWNGRRAIEMSVRRDLTKKLAIMFAGGISILLPINSTTFAVSENDSDLSTAIDAVESVAVLSDEPGTSVFDGAIATSTDTLGDGIFNAEVNGIDLAVPVDPEQEISISNDSGTFGVSVPFQVQTENAEIVENTIIFDHNNGVFTVPVAKQDGSVQLSVVLATPDAPTEIPFPITRPTSSKLTQMGDLVLIESADGEMMAAFPPPWAIDASGSPVPTRYEIRGNDLLQIIEHDGIDYDYPIVADPWLGTALFQSFILNRNGQFKLKNRYSGVLSGWGTAVWTGSAQGGGAAGIAAGQAIIKDAGWSEWKSRLVGVNPALTLKQQFDCHVTFGYAVWAAGVHWDLELARDTNSNWLTNPQGCNWN